MKGRQRIDVERLIVDEGNPRFEVVSTEDDALYSILADQSLSSGNKVLNLARDIANNGLNASELLIVSPIEGTDTYRVREGNRRVTAIKLSLHSERIPEDFGRLKPHFEELTEAMRTHRFIECYVCEDEEEIRRLLLLRHGGENNGIGTVKWNARQTERFSKGGNPQTARALSFIEHLREDYPKSDLWKAAAVLPPTNLGRLITTPEVRQLLNISLNGDDAYYLGGHDDVLIDVLKTLKRRGVGAIYDKKARVGLIEEAMQRLEPDEARQPQLQFDDDRETGGELDSSDANHDGAAKLEPIEEGRRNEKRGKSTEAQSHEPIQGTTANEAFNSQASDALDSPDVALNNDRQDDFTDTSDVRRKPVSKSGNTRMFGHVLRPKGTASNDVYRGIDWIDGQYLRHPDELGHLLPILGFSLRLLMETAAREYFASIGEDRGDKALASFLKDVARPKIKAKIDSVGRNNLALASEWIDSRYNFEGLLSKWAHGTLAVDRLALVRQSELAALIIDEVWT